MIPSATMVPFFHHGSVHDESTALVVFVGATALGPPIHWIIFIVAGVINLALPINLLDGLRWEDGVYCYLVHPFGRSVPFFSIVFLC